MATVPSSPSSPLADVTFQWWDDIGYRWASYTPTNQTQIRQHVQATQLSPTALQSLDFSTVPPLDITISTYGTYTLDFARNVQVNKVTRFERIIRPIRFGSTGSVGHGSGVASLASNQDDDDDDGDEDMEEDYNDNGNEIQDDAEAEVEEKVDIFLPVEFSTLSSTDQCILCLENFCATDSVVIPMNCTGHYFHRHCPNMNMGIADYIQKTKQCPACKKRYGITYGNMPRGSMRVDVLDMSLPGYEKDKTIQITFDFPGGRQGDDHPNPGARYGGDHRVAYLPDCKEGRHVLQMIQKAWNRRLLFTIGTSVTRGIGGCIVYNGIHFKTVPYATPNEPWGYPDPTYLYRIVQELNDKGVY